MKSHIQIILVAFLVEFEKKSKGKKRKKKKKKKLQLKLIVRKDSFVIEERVPHKGPKSSNSGHRNLVLCSSFKDC